MPWIPDFFKLIIHDAADAAMIYDRTLTGSLVFLLLLPFLSQVRDHIMKSFLVISQSEIFIFIGVESTIPTF